MRGILIFAMLLSASIAEARSFYKSEFQVHVEYTNIESGARTIVDGQAVEVRYSDDHEFCQLRFEGVKYECDVFHPNSDPTDTSVTLDRRVVAQLLYDVTAFTLGAGQDDDDDDCDCGCSSSSSSRSSCSHRNRHNHSDDRNAEKELEIIERLTRYLVDPIDLEVGIDFHQDLHDEEAESYNVSLGNLTPGQRY